MNNYILLFYCRAERIYHSRNNSLRKHVEKGKDRMYLLPIFSAETNLSENILRKENTECIYCLFFSRKKSLRKHIEKGKERMYVSPIFSAETNLSENMSRKVKTECINCLFL